MSDLISNQRTRQPNRTNNVLTQPTTGGNAMTGSSLNLSRISMSQWIQLIQQLLQQIQPRPTPVPTPTPTRSLSLSTSEKRILNSLYVADSSGNTPHGYTVSVSDGTNADGRLSAGDTVVVRNGAGNQVSSKTLSTSDVYDLRFRENMVKNTLAVGTGWKFTEDLVGINNGTLAAPITRSYTDANGRRGQETVIERNNYWEVVTRGAYHVMVMRQTDNNGNPVKPSDAINDVFNNRAGYAFDCASPMRLLNLKSTLDTVGEADFNQSAGRLEISSWYDQHDNSTFDGGYVIRTRTAAAGAIKVNGVSNLAGEYALFDTAKGDALKMGGTYYFDKPGDNKTAAQGWNAIYLGRQDDGSDLFWSTEMGTVNVTFEAGSWIPTRGFGQYYLSASVAAPNTARLQSWDKTPSV